MKDKRIVEVLCSPELLPGERSRDRVKRLELAERVVFEAERREIGNEISWRLQERDGSEPHREAISYSLEDAVTNMKRITKESLERLTTSEQAVLRRRGVLR